MNARLNGILTNLAQQNAYLILQHAPQKEGRISYLANGLANNGLLVIVSDIPVNNYDFLMKSWLDAYYQIYNLMSSTLFPMYATIEVGMGDQMRPPVMVLRGHATAVIQMLAGYVVPYVALRQQNPHLASDAEVRGLMMFILEDLAADDLPPDIYNHLARECSKLIRKLVTMPIRQYSLTTMKRQLFQQNQQPESSPKKPAQPRPSHLPETGKLDPRNVEGLFPDNRQHEDNAGSEPAPTQPMPIWFDIDDDDERLPPLPPMPKSS